MKKYSANEIAEYIIKKYNEMEFEITNLSLQSIMFLLQKEFIRKNKKELFTDKISAWNYGPIVENVYYDYSGFGASPICYLEILKNSSELENEIKSFY